MADNIFTVLMKQAICSMSHEELLEMAKPMDTAEQTKTDLKIMKKYIPLLQEEE